MGQRPSNPLLRRCLSRPPGAYVLLDVKKKRLTVEIGGTTKEFAVDNDTKVLGPQGGRRDIHDKQLKPGTILGLVLDGDKLEAVENIVRGVSDRRALAPW
jgi:hypothetical protein